MLAFCLTRNQKNVHDLIEHIFAGATLSYNDTMPGQGYTASSLLINFEAQKLQPLLFRDTDMIWVGTQWFTLSSLLSVERHPHALNAALKHESHKEAFCTWPCTFCPYWRWFRSLDNIDFKALSFHSAHCFLLDRRHSSSIPLAVQNAECVTVARSYYA